MAELEGLHLPDLPASCPICGANMAGLHCKRTCRNCGYVEDCSDLFTHGPIEPPPGDEDEPSDRPA